MLTAYTARMAGLVEAHCDALLVGDSLAQVVYGQPLTLQATLEQMIAHGSAVVRGTSRPLVVVDLPFSSYEGGLSAAFDTAARVLAETGAGAVKLEGGTAMAPTIEFLTKRGIPAMGHVGLTPQSVNALGGAMPHGGGPIRITAPFSKKRAQSPRLEPSRSLSKRSSNPWPAPSLRKWIARPSASARPPSVTVRS